MNSVGSKSVCSTFVFIRQIVRRISTSMSLKYLYDMMVRKAVSLLYVVFLQTFLSALQDFQKTIRMIMAMCAMYVTYCSIVEKSAKKLYILCFYGTIKLEVTAYNKH